jgi:putative methylase
MSPFRDPHPEREQYPTPADLAAHVIHLADLQGDLERPVLDLGAGTGVLAVGAALKGALAVGIEIDPSAIAVGRDNADAAGVDVAWIRGDVGRPPVCSVPGGTGVGGWTVLSNPPFGAQDESDGDEPFLVTASRVAAVSYSIHNAGSRAFVEGVAADRGGTVTHAYRADLDLDRRFSFHEAETRTLTVEVFRIDWR